MPTPTTDPDQSRLTGWLFVLFNAVMGVAHMVVLFNAGSYVALLPHAAGDLGGVLPSFGTWAQTDFLIALALAFPIARWLSCRYGESRVFVGAFLAYAAASALCAIDSTIHAFVPARIVLGLAGGLTLPLGQTLLLKEYPDRLKSMGLAIWGLFTLMPFTAGFAWGGWLADEWGWRLLFYLNIPLALSIAGLTASLFHGRPSEHPHERFDFVGFLLLYVPPRSPDLGSTYFPLSPAIGPGSRGLGPEAGPPSFRREPLDRSERSGTTGRNR
jgi:DHA2 family multidrug resistance protein